MIQRSMIGYRSQSDFTSGPTPYMPCMHALTVNTHVHMYKCSTLDILYFMMCMDELSSYLYVGMLMQEADKRLSIPKIRTHA